ncbi:UDP-N-acetylmuramoyl-tripeptide--D-alanyl-D-alanine ligase [Cellulomonas hominis]|uniref:UDP-N-acetylmuramoyl-tripeptide--D-alanyl-D-alanine ligase n=1 Tax=Cellulomonas hominis TaxID=156981 RepID=A0A511FAU1_9CELL|nr:UDP-N-acetylmuramoyl-tripeptide--D-alanyl-D-alanine ligase [Cellulomonas hominis]MBB5474426.1 UDP-N-acetylmuramoyl-tripeptide--D-alanyl-D-alanine ligase [Cellulomonas hominis]MBU5422622.1 UDP-N-acetylmuramoyl-tripeptide--D-alanyl-D-alanine ligase [Cellulomonas hominis]GEL46345.1 UDP-N-acetylmuramoyl-tripeptide--D-alanyl-D-alanine ligase [Cellulomonas hominis]
MIAMTAAQVAAATGGRLRPADLDPATVVTGPVVVDSRQVEPGSLFVALPGEHVDGHEYAGAAVRAGAALVLAARPVTHDGPDDGGPVELPAVVVDDVEKALGDLARVVLAQLREAAVEPGGTDLRVIGVTGSVGKTTTKDLLAQLCTAAGPTVAPVKSFNNEIGLPLTVLRADEQTRFLVLEMGASGIGHLEYLTSIAPPDVAVVLVVGHAHLEGFGGIDAVARAKAELVAGLAPGGVAVLNADDHRVLAMAAQAPGPVATFGTTTGADLRAVDLRVDRAGRAAFTLDAGRVPPVEGDDSRERAEVTLRLVGEHHVHNALGAAAAALAVGLPLADVAAGLSAADAISPHRMHVVERPDGVTVVDDSYNANPDSMRAALRALAVVAGRERRSIAVLGEMMELGADARREHEAIGLQVVRLNIDLTVVVGAGAHGIAAGAVREGSWGDEVVVVEDVDAAASLLEAELRPGDVVLLKASNGAGLWRLGDLLTGAAGAGVRP